MERDINCRTPVTDTYDKIDMEALDYKVVDRSTITEEQSLRMFSLMDQNYNSMSIELFEKDLKNKKYVGLILDQQDVIQGFTTFAVMEIGSEAQKYGVVFSGDTIIAREHWGTQVLMKGWCETVGSILAQNPEITWYWYLLSKGHRTFLYLPFFFSTYFPSPTKTDRESEYRKVADEVSKVLYPKSWKKDLGVIEFEDSHGELVPELAEATFKKSKSSLVQFFLEKNPKFYQGNELVCITEISPENAIRSAKTFIEAGMSNSILP